MQILHFATKFFTSYLQVPDTHFPAQAARGQNLPGVGVEHDGPRGAGVTHQGLDALPALHLPDVDLVVAMRRAHEGAVVAKGDEECRAHIFWQIQRLLTKKESTKSWERRENEFDFLINVCQVFFSSS